MKVLKFGGSSLASLDLIKKVAENIKDKLKDNDKLVVVASAMGKTTNTLIENMKNSSNAITPREMDQLLSTGEVQSISYLANCLCGMGVKAKSLAGWQAGIITNAVHTDAQIQSIEKQKLQKELKDNDVILVAGFQGICNGEVTTLGRGGSDTTAVALAASLNCPCEIYTDVDGVYSVDPRIVPNAKKFGILSYDQMITMASSGAKVLEQRCSELAKKHNVDLYIGKSLEEKRNGTRIVKNYKVSNKNAVSSIAVRTNLGIIKILAHNKTDLDQVMLKLSSFKAEPISKKNFGKSYIVNAYFDLSNLNAIEKAFENHTKRIKKDIVKISLIGPESFKEKKQAVKTVKAVSCTPLFMQTFKEGMDFISFAVENDQDLKLVKNLADKFEI